MKALGLLILSSITGYAWAVDPFQAPNAPNAGSLLQEIERDYLKPIPKAEPKVAPKKPEEAPKAEQAILVKQFKFQGNHLISEDELQAAFKKYVGQKFTVSELQSIVAEISQIYAARGYVAQGKLPRQDVTDGVITIEIIEAKFGGVLFDPEQKKNLQRVSPEVIEKFVSSGQVIGTSINSANLDRALLITDDLPGIAIQGSLAEGEKDGDTQVFIKAEDKPFYMGDVSLDNQGSRSTGPFRKNANLSLQSPMGYGDLVSVSGLSTQGSTYGRLAYSLPIGYDGLRVGANASYMRYELITEETQSTKPRGDSKVVGLDAQYPIIRSQITNLYVNAAYDLKLFKNEYLGTTGYETSSDYQLQVLSLGLSGNQYDDFMTGGLNSASINLGMGKVDLSGSPSTHQANDAAGAATAGNYGRFRWNASRHQNIIEDLTLLMSASGQWASKNLDSSEKFYLGGPTGVRAYPNSEGGGSEGYSLSLELRQRLPEGFLAAVFYDWGQVKQYAKNIKADGTPMASLNQFNLSGYGASIAWDGPYRSTVRAIVARRIGANPNPTSTGNDQDGSLKQNRFWITGSIPF